MSEVKVPLAVVVAAWEDEGMKTCQGARCGLNSLGLQVYLSRVRENTRSAEENGFQNRRCEKFEAAARNTQVFLSRLLFIRWAESGLLFVYLRQDNLPRCRLRVDQGAGGRDWDRVRGRAQIQDLDRARDQARAGRSSPSHWAWSSGWGSWS